MTKSDGGDSGGFSELFDLIRNYAKRDRAHQEKALRLITVAYEGPPEIEGMPDVRQTVDDILGRFDYVFPIREFGTLDPRSVDAVVRVALYEEGNREWGIDRLARMLRGLVRRLDAEGGYPDYAEDTGMVMTGLQTVVSGALVEEIVEELQEIAEELVEDAVPEGKPLMTDAPRILPGVVLGEEEAVASPGGDATLIDRQELMDLLAKAGTPTEVAVARDAADSYLASNPSDGDVRAARDRLPASGGGET